MGRLVIVALVTLALLPAKAYAKMVKRFAIVVGHNQPDDPSLPVLRYADDDAIATYQLLREAGVSARLLVSPDKDTRRLQKVVGRGAPTWRNLRQAVFDVNQQIVNERRRGNHTELLFFYSGHGGVKNGQGYVVLVDQRLDRQRLYTKVLKASRAHQNHVIVDACKSFFLAFSKGPGGSRRAFGRSFASQALPSKLNNTGFVLSTSSDRDSHEWERFQAGVFSYEVRSGLRGGADANADGNVTYAELGAFLRVANRAIPNPRFRPQFTVRPPGGKRDLSQSVLSWNNSDSILHIDVTLGRVHVETDLGIRVVDVHPAKGTKMIVHLPKSRPMFVRTGNEQEERILTASSTQLSQLQKQPVRLARKGALHLAFAKLFSSPFGVEDVALYSKEYRWDLSPPSRSRRKTVARVAGWSAIAAGTLGVSATLLAFQRQGKGKNIASDKRDNINSQIRTLNRASIVLYGVAGAAAATWLTAKYWPERSPPKVVIAPGAGGGALLYSTQW